MSERERPEAEEPTTEYGANAERRTPAHEPEDRPEVAPSSESGATSEHHFTEPDEKGSRRDDENR